jgi:predicted O-methyltransferase YrrM
MPTTTLDQLRNRFIKGFKRIQMNTTPGDATFLRILVESSRATRGLEIGTATGYGAILMGLGFEKNGGKLISIDPDPRMVNTACRNISKMELQETVSVLEGEALEIIRTLKGKFDFVFIDAIKEDYLKYLRAIEPKLKPGSIIVADNVIQHAKRMSDFLNAVLNDPRYHTVIIRASEEKGDGMTVSYRL